MTFSTPPGVCSHSPSLSLALSIYLIQTIPDTVSSAPPRRRVLAAALEERDVTLGVLLDGGPGVGGVGGMGLSVGQRLALERALRQCKVNIYINNYIHSASARRARSEGGGRGGVGALSRGDYFLARPGKV